jgi:hypothetical protein
MLLATGGVRAYFDSSIPSSHKKNLLPLFLKQDGSVSVELLDVTHIFAAKRAPPSRSVIIETKAVMRHHHNHFQLFLNSLYPTLTIESF